MWILSPYLAMTNSVIVTYMTDRQLDNWFGADINNWVCKALIWSLRHRGRLLGFKALRFQPLRSNRGYRMSYRTVISERIGQTRSAERSKTKRTVKNAHKNSFRGFPLEQRPRIETGSARQCLLLGAQRSKRNRMATAQSGREGQADRLTPKTVSQQRPACVGFIGQSPTSFPGVGGGGGRGEGVEKGWRFGGGGVYKLAVIHCQKACRKN